MFPSQGWGKSDLSPEQTEHWGRADSTRIWEVRGSNLGVGTGYSDEGFCWFFFFCSPDKCWDGTSN
jgi:hypothetical protein